MNGQHIQGNGRSSVAYLTIIQLLTARHLPARLAAWMVAALLGYEEAHIPILVKAKLLKPLGNPKRNAPKYFARDYILALASNSRWLDRASEVLPSHWAERNAKKKANQK